MNVMHFTKSEMLYKKTMQQSMSNSKGQTYQKKLNELIKKIQDAEKKRIDCYNAIAAVRR